MNFFKEKTNNIFLVSETFKEHFGSQEVGIPKTLTLKSKKLEKDMLDKEILSEWKPQESTLGELAYAMQNDLLGKDGYANIFYIRDDSGTLWAVAVLWYSGDGWYVDAYSVEDPDRWHAGAQVFSRDFSDHLTPLTLNPSETLTVSEPLKKGDKVRVTDGKIVKVKVCSECHREL